MTDVRLPFLAGRTPPRGPGHPYAIDGHGTVRGALVTAAPGAYAELLGLLDDLEQHLGPHHPRNPYERVARRAVPGPLPDTPGGASGEPGPAEPVRAWVHLAATAVPRSPRTGGTPVPGGDRLSRRPPPARRTP